MIKQIVCDASSLISLSENCMLPALQKLAGKAQLVVPGSVYDEVVVNPMHSRKYSFKAFLIQGYFTENLIHVYNNDIYSRAQEIMNIANSVFEIKNRPLKIIHVGEAAAIAVCNELKQKMLMIDERTTRLLIEDPLKVRDYMESRMNASISVDHNYLSKFQEISAGIKIIRSAELAVYAHENGWFNHRATEQTLASMLYALKFAGCSITEEEIEKYKEMFG